MEVITLADSPYTELLHPVYIWAHLLRTLQPICQEDVDEQSYEQ